jgi:hypothetical protein
VRGKGWTQAIARAFGELQNSCNRFARDDKENGLVKPPKRDTRALSPAGMFEGKAPLGLATQKSRPHAPSVPMRSEPAYFLCKWEYKLD